VATAFTRLAGFARVFRARVAALFALDVRLLVERFLVEPFLAELFLAVLFLAVLFLAVLFLPALFLAALFLVVARFFRAVAVLRLRAVTPFLAAALRFRGAALRFDAERALLARLRPVAFRPADFALEFPRDDFLVVAIHALLVSR
jgi:hypothetical protein